MTNDSLISIIVPIYNVEDFLSRCIDSILNQSYRNIEVILIDDGSPDNCGKICDCYAKKDSRVIVKHKSNGGLSDTRNAGLKIASGKYVCFVDSDDYLDVYYVEKLYMSLIQNNADVSLCNLLCVDEQGNPIDKKNYYSPINTEVLSGKEAIQKLSEQRGWYFVVAWNKLYKKEIFNDISFPKGKFHEDEYVVHEVFGKCKIVSCVKEPYYFYTQRSNSIMGQKKWNKEFDAAEALLNRSIYLKSAGENKLSVYYYIQAHKKYSECYIQCLKNKLPFKNRAKNINKQFKSCHSIRYLCSKSQIRMLKLIEINPVIYKLFIKIVQSL